MPLQSRLLKGDRALEACLVNDAAHVVEGAQGSHVLKLQQALALLDGALISLDESRGQRYGKTTASAVLDYKRARQIINTAYQSTADNIVGKMTIASLDRELAKNDARPSLSGGCLNERHRGGGGGLALTQTGVQSVGDAPSAPPTVLHVEFQDALGENEIGIATSTRILLLSVKAVKLLAPFNISLRSKFLGFFPFPKLILETDVGDVEGIRKAAQKANAGSDNALRMIFCSFIERKGFPRSTASSNGQVTFIEGFPNFVLLNKEVMHPDFGTLVHEMIHCSDDFLMSDIMHDTDRNSIFSFGDNRTIINKPHVAALRKCFFK